MSHLILDKVYMRSIMIRDKKFLLSLFNGEKNVLNNATDIQMNTLIRIIHLILNNEIPLLETNFLALKRTKRMKTLIQNFNKQNNFLVSLKLTTELKRKLLQQYSACYPHLLFSIFVNSN